jgi:GNAT superfamily N-acetyltransferase
MIQLEPLTGHHNRKSFDCGVPALNAWLAKTALQHQQKGISRTFVAVPSTGADSDEKSDWGYGNLGQANILGFYALSSAFVFLEDLPPEFGKRYPRQIPVTRLGRLAIEVQMQGQGLGKLLLADAVSRARSAAQTVGSAGIFVDAKDMGGTGFYLRFGFRPCGNQPLKLYLPIW